MDLDEFVRIAEQLENDWLDESVQETRDALFQKFGVGLGASMPEVDTITTKLEMMPRTLLSEIEIRKSALTDGDAAREPENVRALQMWKEVEMRIEIVKDCILTHSRQLADFLRQRHIIRTRTFQSVNVPFRYKDWHMAPVQEDVDTTDFMKACKAVYRRLHLKGYRRVDDRCYRKVYTQEGHETCAYEYVKEIREFVNCDTIDEKLRPTEYQLLCGTPNMIDAVIKHTSNRECPDHFPSIRRNRLLFSFRDGIYNAESNEFYSYTRASPLGRDEVTAKYTPFFLNFDSVERIRKEQGCSHIPTPRLEKILLDQKLPLGAIRLFYVVLGRMLFPLGTHDDWQIIPFVKGRAGTGKGTLCKIISMFYDPADVAWLNNSQEKMFGLEAMVDKFIFLGPEIKSNFGMEQAIFQQIVSGEHVSIARKYKMAVTVEWRLPGFLVGNEVPSWQDNSGSITRRILLFEFMQKIDVLHNNLFAEIREELPTIIYKSRNMYLHYVDECGDADFWSKAPHYFKETQKHMRCQTNALEMYINSSNLKKTGHEEDFVPFNDFVAQFQRYCSTMNYRAPKFTEDLYMGVFQINGVRLEKGTVRKSFGRRERGDWIVGIRWTQQEQQEQDEALSQSLPSQSDSQQVVHHAQQAMTHLAKRQKLGPVA